MPQPDAAPALPKIIITIEGGVITDFAADRPVHIVVIDHDVKNAGGRIGEIIERLQPDDIRSPAEIDEMVTNTTNELIDEGY